MNGLNKGIRILGLTLFNINYIFVYIVIHISKNRLSIIIITTIIAELLLTFYI